MSNPENKVSTNIEDEKEKWLPLKENFSTLAIHAGYSPKSSGYSSVVPPITLSTTYEIDAPAINRVRSFKTLKL